MCVEFNGNFERGIVRDADGAFALRDVLPEFDEYVGNPAVEGGVDLRVVELKGGMLPLGFLCGQLLARLFDLERVGR